MLCCHTQQPKMWLLLLLGCSHIDSMWHFHQEHATYFITPTATCCRRELSLTGQSRGQKEVEWRRVRDGGLGGLTVFCHLLWLCCIVQAPNPLPWQWYFLIHGTGICDHTSSLKKKKKISLSNAKQVARSVWHVTSCACCESKAWLAAACHNQGVQSMVWQ